MARIITNGAVGATWTNTTGKVQYQLLVQWRNSCGLCCQYDRAIGPLWPTPFHRGCRCLQKALWPNAESDPFVDFRVKIQELDRAQRSRVIGRSNLVLVEAGVVTWDDVVTNARIRTLREVVSREKLTIQDLTNAGVVRRLAENAYQSVHTPAHELAEADRREAIARLLGSGLDQAQVRERFGARISGRVGIAEGPSGPGAMPMPRPKPKGPIAPATAAALLVGLGIKPEAIAPAPATIPAKTPLPAPSDAEFRDFRKDTTAIDEWIGTNFREWSDRLDDSTRRVIDDYSASGYVGLNGHLRAVDKGEAVPSRPLTLGKIETIKAAATPLPENVVLWRGANAAVFPNFKKLKGEMLLDAGFVSTSPDRNVSESGQFSHGLLFKLKVPAGTPVVSVQAANRETIGEREMLLMPGTKVRVTRVRKVYFDTHMIEAEVIP